MCSIKFKPMPTDYASSIWQGGTDALGNKPEVHTSGAHAVPCRHCLQDVNEGEDYLILSYSPFPDAQPYAEVGPVFLHAKPCKAYKQQETMPDIYVHGAPRLIRGYDENNRIMYGTGTVVEPEQIEAQAQELLSNSEVAYVHLRSAGYNCFSCLIERD